MERNNCNFVVCLEDTLSISDLNDPDARISYLVSLRGEDKFIHEAMFSGDQTFLSKDERESFLKNLRDRSLSPH